MQQITLENSSYIFVGPPIITTSLETKIKNRSVKLTGNVVIYDDSPGFLECFWTKNDEKIHVDTTRTENPSLTITNVGPDDAGEYRLTAINAAGSSTSGVIALGILAIILLFVLYNMILFVWNQLSPEKVLKPVSKHSKNQTCINSLLF